MGRLILQQLRRSPGRGLALAAGILVAAVSFSLLTAATSTEVAGATATVQSNLRPAYDILVLPRGSTSGLEQQQGLVRDNFLSGIYGGISLAQYQQITKIPGVEVAAPIAMIGYVLVTVDVPIDVSALLAQGSHEVLEVSDSRSADNGLTHDPAQSLGYVYATPDSLVFEAATGTYPFMQLTPMQETLPNGATASVCPQYSAEQQSSPYADYQADGAVCWSWKTAFGLGFGPGGPGGAAPPITANLEISYPLLIAAIDPKPEEALDGLAQAIVEGGRYLSESDAPTTITGTDARISVPVLATTDPYEDDADTVTVSRLPSSAVNIVEQGGTPESVAAALASQPGTPVMTQRVTSDQLYSQLVQVGPLPRRNIERGYIPIGLNLFDAYWQVSPVTYEDQGGVLVPATVSNPPSVWASSNDSVINYITFHAGWEAVPTDTSDTGFRSVTEVPAVSPPYGQSGPPLPWPDIVGQFDPSKVEGFSALSAVPLEFSPPLATGANAASQRALGNKPLSPDANLAGYLQEPPLLFTTLSALPAFASSFPTAEARAPISSIRIRVGGLHGSIPEQLAQVAQVAAKVRSATGLQVDTTAGSSPTTETIALPAGKYARPALLLHENWVKLGAALVITAALDQKSVALFALILLVTALFLMNGSVAAVRGRRREIGVLRCLGWKRRSVFRLILGELLLLGTLAGLAGSGISWAVIVGFHLDMPLWRVGLITPVAVALAGIAGIIPAWLATRGEPLDAVRPAVTAPRRGAAAVRRIVGLAWSNLRRRPARAALAAAALGVGIAALTVLLGIELAFGRQVSGSLLGNFIYGEVRGVDYLSAALAICLGAASVADVLYLNLQERAAEVAVLSATGWRRRYLTRLAVYEGAGIGLLGSLVGAGVGLGVTWALGGPPVALLQAAAMSMAAGTALAALATWLVVTGASRRPIAAAVAEEE